MKVTNPTFGDEVWSQRITWDGIFFSFCLPIGGWTMLPIPPNLGEPFQQPLICWKFHLESWVCREFFDDSAVVMVCILHPTTLEQAWKHGPTKIVAEMVSDLTPIILGIRRPSRLADTAFHLAVDKLRSLLQGWFYPRCIFQTCSASSSSACCGLVPPASSLSIDRMA